MFAGHVGAGLAAGAIEPRVNAGVFVAAALLLDIVLWLLVLPGVESVVIPPDFMATHQPEFTFPISHGLAGSIGWSALAAAVAFAVIRGERPVRLRAAVVMAAAVFSHWLLDALVHRPELPLLGDGSAKVGLGLWAALPVALVVEAVLALAGLVMFLRAVRPSRARGGGLAALTLLLFAFTAIGMTIAPPPPSAAAMAASSLVTIALVCALYGWLAGRRR